MLARLGNALYWLGCIIAGLIVIYAGVIYSTEGYARSEDTGLLVVFALMAFAVWLVGRLPLRPCGDLNRGDTDMGGKLGKTNGKCGTAWSGPAIALASRRSGL
jgi:hypothetical protein